MTNLPANLLRRVQRPARYVGGEPGQTLKDPEAVTARVALCFPDAYEIGMSHLGLRILYSRLNADERIWCERAFAPMADMEAELRRRGLPLTTLESATPLAELDLLGFSLQHELCATNVLLMLDLGGLPLRAAERSEDHPLVLAGGPMASHPEPLAPFVDAFAIGDGEALAEEIALTWAGARRRGASRAEALEALAGLESVYVPALAQTSVDPGSRRLVVDGARVSAARLDDLDRAPFPTDAPVPITEAVFDRAMVEIARGCGGGCRFCQAGMIYRPMRERSPSAIASCLQSQIRRGGYDEASLTSLSTADYSQIATLLPAVSGELAEHDVALSVSSLRAFGLDRSLTEALAAVRTSSLTLAPEAGSQRLRDVINKNISDEDILRGAEAAITRKRRRLKLYFMIGLPTETDDDLRAIAELALRIRAAVGGRSKKRLALTVSASTFVPKPHTPLQWCAAIGPDEVVRRQDLLRSLLRPARIELRSHDVRLSMIEALLSRADRRAADLVEDAYRSGARFDSWDEYFDDQAWKGALERWPVDPAELRAEIPRDARLPWDHIDVGPTRAFLAREHRRALRGRPTSPCLRLDSDGEVSCHSCGLDCDLEAERERLEARRLDAEELRARQQRQTEVERSDADQDHARLRLLFEKAGDLTWVGHLDTARLLQRLLRRAEVHVAYSRGFHPKPKISFAAPLSLGTGGLAEVVDLTVVGHLEAEALLERLRAQSPPGLRFRAARLLEPTEVACTKALTAAELLLASDELALDLDTAVAELLARPRLEVERKRGPVDLRPALLDLAPLRPPRDPLPARLELPETAVVATISLGRGATIRAEELAHWLGVAEGDYQALRLGLLRDPLPAPLI